MFDWARALEHSSLLKKHRDDLDGVAYSAMKSKEDPRGIAILTNAGGPGVIAADSLEHNGLPLAQFAESTLEALNAKLSPAANVRNPVDMLASAAPDTYAACLKILLEDDNVDGVLVILPPPPVFKAEDVAEKIVETLQLSGKPLDLKKPIVVALMGSMLIEKAAQIFQWAHIPTYPFPERAVSALGALVKRGEYLERIQHPSTPDTARKSKVSEVRRLQTPVELLAAYGIETASIKLARSIDEAISIAAELRYPVVMKIASPDILHKSDIGGVIQDIRDSNELHSAHTEMLNRVKETKPEALIEGVYIQQQILDGQEVILGAVRDPQFGPLMMFGSGGVEVEGLNDVAFALAPLNRAEAEKLIRKTWAGRKLKGFRHIPPADEESVIDVLIKLSWLVFENESIEEIEINPLKVLSKGAVAVDVRTR
jgi:acetyltransferase